MSEPTTPTGKRLIDKQVWVGVSRDLKAEVLAIEAEAREQARAALADELPEDITRWLMGEGMVIVHRWMTTGWRETMYDEGVAIWTAALAKWEASR